MVDPLQRRFTQSESRQRYQEGRGPRSTAGGPIDIAWFAPGKPEASDLIFQFVAVRPFLLPADFFGSEAYVAVAPADEDKTLDVFVNGTLKGFMVFAQGSNAADPASFFFPETTFSAGDRLEVTAPGTQDSAMADISVTFKGTKQ